MQSAWHPRGHFHHRRYNVSRRAKATMKRDGKARLTILMVSKANSAVEIQEFWLISTDQPSPTSAIGQRPSRGTRGSRRSQLQAVSTPLVNAKVGDGTEQDQKEIEEKEDDMAANEEEIKVNANASKAASSKAKKRRSGRRR